MNEFMNQHYQKALAEIQSIADRHFMTKLAEAGFVFHSKQELAAFCSEHLTALAFEDKHPDYRELWLDREKPTERLICTYWDRYDIDWKFDSDNYTCTIVWGQEPPQTLTR